MNERESAVAAALARWSAQSHWLPGKPEAVEALIRQRIPEGSPNPESRLGVLAGSIEQVALNESRTKPRRPRSVEEWWKEVLTDYQEEIG